MRDEDSWMSPAELALVEEARIARVVAEVAPRGREQAPACTLSRAQLLKLPGDAQLRYAQG